MYAVHYNFKKILHSLSFLVSKFTKLIECHEYYSHFQMKTERYREGLPDFATITQSKGTAKPGLRFKTLAFMSFNLQRMMWVDNVWKHIACLN